MNLIDNVSIKRARDDEAVILANICKEAFHTDVETGMFPEPAKPGGPPGYDSPDFQKFIMSVMKYYKILLNDKIIGGLFFDIGNAEHYVLERIFVSPAYHNRGAGMRAIELAHEKHPEAKIWTLGTPKWNPRTQHFYEKCGYVQVGWEEVEDPKWWGVWYQKTAKQHTFPKIKELEDGLQAITVEGKVISVSPASEKTAEDGKGTVLIADAELADDSGTISLELKGHHLKCVTEGKRIRVERGNVSTQEGKSLLQLLPWGRIITLL
ncbi:MAG: GNAT family N-acetyltransferase [Candidatus Hodarchaeales archaeon]|jgi:GNAT superfamily N-acetyltransferase